MSALSIIDTKTSECQVAIIPLLMLRRRSTNSMYHQKLLLGLLFMICTRVPSATGQSSNMTLNGTLVASRNETLLSPGGIFEMGFYAGAQPQTYTLAIWYAKAAKAVVWMANRSLNLSSDATLLFTAQGDLEVYSDGDLTAQPQWTSAQTTTLNATGNATTAALWDTGNLVLLNAKNQILWQSFDTPTDTLLPGQNFAASTTATISAWQGPTNWSQGSYSLSWIDEALRASYHQPPTPYATSPPADIIYWNSNNTNSTYAVLTAEGYFQAADALGNVQTIIGNSTDAGLNRFRRFTIGSDGNLRIYSWDGKSWTVVWTAVSSICTLYNYCGSYGICDNTDLPGTCLCPHGFEAVSVNDPTQGCKRIQEIVTTVIDNGENSTTVVNELDMYQLELVDFTSGIHYEHNQNISLKICLERCLSSSICEAVVATDADSAGIVTDCWLKTILYAGQLYVQHKSAYVKLAVSPTRKEISRERQAMIGLGAVTAALLVLSFGMAPILWFALIQKVRSRRVGKLEEKWVAAKGVTVNFTFGEIRLATRNFEQQIGKGGYGSVFRGEIGQQALVAVKRLDKLSPSDDEFVNEVNTIGCIHHVNLVKLHGYCAESNHKLLVYEFVENSSLDKVLFRRDENSKSESPILEWRYRFRIAIQTARGLAYLHEDVRDQRIIHCDIKPENILLDAKLSAKVADFGLSRILNREQTRTMTKRIRGTTGYLAPEWTSENTPITAKIDVFSFGMVLLEIVSGRRNLRPYWIHDHEIHDSQPDCRYFPQWAFPKIETDNFLEVVDGSLHGIVDAKQVKRALLVAFWCINENPNQRPTMSKVVQLLEGHIPIEQPVPKPRFLDEMELGSPIRTSRYNSSRDSETVTSAPTDPYVTSASGFRVLSQSTTFNGR